MGHPPPLPCFLYSLCWKRRASFLRPGLLSLSTVRLNDKMYDRFTCSTTTNEKWEVQMLSPINLLNKDGIECWELVSSPLSPNAFVPPHTYYAIYVFQFMDVHIYVHVRIQTYAHTYKHCIRVLHTYICGRGGGMRVCKPKEQIYKSRTYVHLISVFAIKPWDVFWKLSCEKVTVKIGSEVRSRSQSWPQCMVMRAVLMKT